MSNPLSQNTIAIIKATVPALEQHGPLITETMYRRLFENAEIAALFNQANQKSGAQRLALAQAVLAYARNIENLAVLGPAVERIAQKHIGYAILPEHYPYVGTALLGAIEEVLGDAATPGILNAWGEAYWFLANILTGRETVIRSQIMAQPGGWTDWRRFVITDRQIEARGITSFTLHPEDGGPVIAHAAGQYLTLRFDVAGLVGVKRNYSISSAPNADSYRITVKRMNGGEASCFLHDHVDVGTILEATPPSGDFHLPETQHRPLVLLSGGVGLTPMVSMLETISQHHPDLPVWYIHGTTNPDYHVLNAQVQAAARRHGTTSIATFYEDGAANQGQAGMITMDWLQKNTPLADADIYLCGPRPFLRYFVPELRQAGVPADRIHFEFFGPADEDLTA